MPAQQDAPRPFALVTLRRPPVHRPSPGRTAVRAPRMGPCLAARGVHESYLRCIAFLSRATEEALEKSHTCGAKAANLHPSARAPLNPPLNKTHPRPIKIDVRGCSAPGPNQPAALTLAKGQAG